MAKQIIGAQGEITIIKLDALPEGIEIKTVERDAYAGGFIISHSENGHHHLLVSGADRADSGAITVMERTDNVPVGMQVLYALLDAPASLIQDAAVPHGGYDLDPGIYAFKIAREYDPFAEQARRVAD